MPDFVHNRLLAGAAIVQGVYYVVTGLWAIVSIYTFQIVTGPKTDLWLVRTVAVLVLVSGAVFLLAALRRRISLEIVVLAVGNAVGLLFIDVIYVSAGTISPIYLLDAVAEFALAAAWLYGWQRKGPPKRIF